MRVYLLIQSILILTALSNCSNHAELSPPQKSEINLKKMERICDSILPWEGIWRRELVSYYPNVGDKKLADSSIVVLNRFKYNLGIVDSIDVYQRVSDEHMSLLFPSTKMNSKITVLCMEISKDSNSVIIGYFQNKDSTRWEFYQYINSYTSKPWRAMYILFWRDGKSVDF